VATTIVLAQLKAPLRDFRSVLEAKTHSLLDRAGVRLLRSDVK